MKKETETERSECSESNEPPSEWVRLGTVRPGKSFRRDESYFRIKGDIAVAPVSSAGAINFSPNATTPCIDGPAQYWILRCSFSEASTSFFSSIRFSVFLHRFLQLFYLNRCFYFLVQIVHFLYTRGTFFMHVEYFLNGRKHFTKTMLTFFLQYINILDNC